MPGIVHAADPHLSRLTWADRPEVTGDSFYAIWQVINFCLINRAALSLLGDAFDNTRPDPTAVAEACRALDKMEEAGLPVFYIQGNHEYDAYTPWLSVHSWPQHVDQRVFEVDQMKFYGLDWRPSAAIKEALKAVPPDVTKLAMHQSMAELMGTITQPECSTMDIPDHVTTVVVGDYHKHTSYTAAFAGRQTKTLYSPGPFNARNILQSGPKGVWYMVDGEVRSIQIRTRQIIDETVHTPEDLDRVMSQVNNWRTHMHGTPISEPLVRIHYAAGEFPDAGPRMASWLGGPTHLFLDMVAAATIDVQAAAETIVQHTPETLIAAHVPDEQTRSRLTFLLQPQRTARKAVEEIMNEIAQTNSPQLVPVPGAGD